MSGNKDNLPQIPDGNFLPPWSMNCIEKHIESKIANHYNDRVLTIGRTTNLTNLMVEGEMPGKKLM